MTHDDAFDQKIAAMLAADEAAYDDDADRFARNVLGDLDRRGRRRRLLVLIAALTGGAIAAFQAPALAADIEAFAAGASPGVLEALSLFGPEAIAAVTIGAMLIAFAFVAPSEI